MSGTLLYVRLQRAIDEVHRPSYVIRLIEKTLVQLGTCDTDITPYTLETIKNELDMVLLLLFCNVKDRSVAAMKGIQNMIDADVHLRVFKNRLMKATEANVGQLAALPNDILMCIAEKLVKV
jgi:hypothetical protein